MPKLFANSKEEIIEYCKKFGYFLPVSPNMTLQGTSSSKDQTAIPTMANSPNSKHGDEYGPLGWEPSYDNMISVPSVLFRQLRTELRNPKNDNALLKVCSREITRTFVYFDISDFSKYLPGQQALIISSFVALSNYPSIRDHFRTEADLCIGDGYIFVFNGPFTAVQFAAHLAMGVEISVAERHIPVTFHFRMGVHTGKVNTFWDSGRKDWNYVGEGINGGSRVLEAIGKDRDDVIYISEDAKYGLLQDKLMRTQTRNIISSLTNMGRKLDKHGKPWRVWMLDYLNYTTAIDKENDQWKKEFFANGLGQGSEGTSVQIE